MPPRCRAAWPWVHTAGALSTASATAAKSTRSSSPASCAATSTASPCMPRSSSRPTTASDSSTCAGIPSEGSQWEPSVPHPRDQGLPRPSPHRHRAPLARSRRPRGLSPAQALARRHRGRRLRSVHLHRAPGRTGSSPALPPAHLPRRPSPRRPVGKPRPAEWRIAALRWSAVKGIRTGSCPARPTATAPSPMSPAPIGSHGPRSSSASSPSTPSPSPTAADRPSSSPGSPSQQPTGLLRCAGWSPRTGAYLTDGRIVRKILEHLKLSTDPPSLAPARPPPEPAFDC